MITPDVLQRWISRSYFGTDGGIIFEGRGSDRFCNWGAEVKALDEVIAEAKLAQKKDREAASTEHR